MIEITRLELDTKVLDAIAKSLGTNTDGAVRSVAGEVEAESKQLAPVDTGALVNSIHAEKVEESEYRVQDGVNYGIYQELGTYKMAAHPFLSPAVEKVGARIAEFFKRLFP